MSLRALLRATPWRQLSRADLGTADAVPGALYDLCRGRSPRVRETARRALYCPLSNQGTAGEASPVAVELLVRSLREGWCRDREPVYYVLELIGTTTVVRPAESTAAVLGGIRTALDDGLDVFLADLGTPDLPSLTELLIFLAPRHEVVLERLRAAGADEAYRDALEHVEEAG